MGTDSKGCLSGGWISVGNRLPAEEEKCLVVFEDTGDGSRRWVEVRIWRKGWWEYDKNTFIHRYYGNKARIVYWQPFPEPPAEHRGVG